jgi:hypothetical protein
LFGVARPITGPMSVHFLSQEGENSLALADTATWKIPTNPQFPIFGRRTKMTVNGQRTAVLLSFKNVVD